MASALAASWNVCSDMAGSPRRIGPAPTSNSSNSYGRPAASRTLTAWGTTSCPARSPGMTAMCMSHSVLPGPSPLAGESRVDGPGSGRDPLASAQLEALDLARRRLRQVRHEVEVARALEVRQRGADVVAQLHLQLRAGRPAGLQDHVRLRADEALLVHHRHHRTLQHRVVRVDHRLDLGRADPDATHLEHVVAAALVAVIAVRIAQVLV